LHPRSRVNVGKKKGKVERERGANTEKGSFQGCCLHQTGITKERKSTRWQLVGQRKEWNSRSKNEECRRGDHGNGPEGVSPKKTLDNKN